MKVQTTLFLAFALALAGSTPAAAAPGKAKAKSVKPSGQSADFEFDDVSGSTWYYLWISGPSGAVHKKWYQTVDITCDGTTCTITPAISLPPGQYKWWVQTWDSSGSGPWSDADEFAMGAGSGLEFDLDASVGAPVDALYWIDHLAFRGGSDAVAVSFDAFDSAVGAGATGLQVEAGAVDDVRVVEQGLSIPPGLLVDGVRLCFESSAAGAFIDEVRIEQLSDPPSATNVVLLDDTDLALAGAQCVDTASPAAPIDPAMGPLRLQLGFTVGAGERVVLRGVGLQVVSDANDPVQLELQAIKAALESVGGHTHTYLTGRGNGHNNTQAVTGGAIVPAPEAP